MSSQRPFYVATVSANIPPPHTAAPSIAPSTQQPNVFGKSYISPLTRAGNAVASGSHSNLSTQGSYNSKYAYTELSHIDTSNDCFEKPLKGLIEEMRTVNTDERILRKQAFDRHHWHSTLEFVFIKNQLDNNGNIPQSQTSKHARSSETRSAAREARKPIKNAALPLLTTDKLPDMSRILDWTACDWASFRALEQKAAQRNVDLVKFMYLLPDENPAVGAPPPIPPEAQRLAALTAHGTGDGSLSLGMVLGAAGIGVDWLTQCHGDPRLEARNILHTAANSDPREGSVSWLWRPSAQKHMKYLKIARITLAELIAHTQMHGSGRRRREQAGAGRESDDRTGDMQMDGGRSEESTTLTGVPASHLRRGTGSHRGGGTHSLSSGSSGSVKGERGLQGEAGIEEEAQERQRVAVKYAETERWGKKWMAKLRGYEAGLSTSVLGRREMESERRDVERERSLAAAALGTGVERDIGENAAPAPPQWQNLYGNGAGNALQHAVASVNQATKKKHDSSSSSGVGAHRRSQWSQGERVTLGLAPPAPLVVPALRAKTLTPAELVTVRESDLEMQRQVLEQRFGIEEDDGMANTGTTGSIEATSTTSTGSSGSSGVTGAAVGVDGVHTQSARRKIIPGLLAAPGDGFMANSNALQLAASRLSLLSAALSGHAMPLPVNTSAAPYLRALAAPAQFAHTLIQPGAHTTPLLQTNHSAPLPSSASATNALGDLCARVITVNHSLGGKQGWTALSEAAGAPVTGYGDRDKGGSGPTLWCQCNHNDGQPSATSQGSFSHGDTFNASANMSSTYTCTSCGGALRLPNAPISEVPPCVRAAAKAIFPRLVRDQTRLSRTVFRQRLLLAGLDPSLPFFADRLFRCVSPAPTVALEARDYASAVLVTVHNDPLYRALLLHAVLDLDDDGVLTLHDLYAGTLLGLAKQFPGDYSMLLHFAMAKLAATTPSLHTAGLVAPLLDTFRDEKLADTSNGPRAGNTSSSPCPGATHAEDSLSRPPTSRAAAAASMITAPLVLPANRADPSVLQWGALNTVPLPPPAKLPPTASGTGLVFNTGAPAGSGTGASGPGPSGAGAAAPPGGSIVVSGGAGGSAHGLVQAGHNPQLHGPPNVFAQSVLVPSQGTHIFPHASSHSAASPQAVPALHAPSVHMGEREGLATHSSPRNSAVRGITAPNGVPAYPSFSSPSPSHVTVPGASGGSLTGIASHATGVPVASTGSDSPSSCVCAMQSGPLYASAQTPFWTAQGPVLLCSRGPIIADYHDISVAENAAGRGMSWAYTVDECECVHRDKGQNEQPVIGKGASLGLGVGVSLGSAASRKDKEASTCACDCHRGDTSVHVRLCAPGEATRIPLHVVKQTLRVPVGTLHHASGQYGSMSSANAASAFSDDVSTRALREVLERDPMKRQEYMLFRARCERLLQVPSIRQYTHHIHKSEISGHNVIITPMELVDMISRWDNSDIIRLLQLALLFPDLRNIHGNDPEVVVYAREAAPWDRRFRQ